MIGAQLSALAQGDDPSLIGRWLFNEGSGITALDSTSNGNNGTVSGAAFFNTGDPERGNVLTVNGTSGEVTFPVTTSVSADRRHHCHMG